MDFEPIAIVGMGCVFPGVFAPGDLWDGLLCQQDFLSAATEEDWRLTARGMNKWYASNPWSTRGGYIRGFDEMFDPNLFCLPTEVVAKSDRLIQWLLYAGRQALISAGMDSWVDSTRAGVIVGNLSLPSRGLSSFAESVFANELGVALGLEPFAELVTNQQTDPIERFMSGRPAHVLAQAFGLGAGAVALDAACASSLYAIRLACDWLHQGRADVMLAGAVNGADPLFLHTGFRVLKASSPSGQSRPFHRQADGLVPSEGAGVVVLKRWSNAVAAGDKILGIIRGVGLSNDGGSRGFLVPSESGQVDAMTRAYVMSGVKPEEVSFVECHATGTPLGDATELASMARVFQDANEISIGSSKSNLGHLVTASGMPSLMKALLGFEHRLLPANIHTDDPLSAAVTQPFHLLTEQTVWTSDHPRLAAINSFGFGGNNAHLIVEEWAGQAYNHVPSIPIPELPSESDTVAVVGIGVVTGTARGKRQFVDAILQWGSNITEEQGSFIPRTSQVHLNPRDMRYPPKDLDATLPQQLLLLEAAREAMSGVVLDETKRVGVMAGMQCDAEITKHIAKFRADDWVAQWNQVTGTPLSDVPEEWAESLFNQPLTAAGVIGLLPNMVANRLSHFFGLTGPAFSISSEELSGLDALITACEMLHQGEIDMGLVGASDLSCETVHAEALRKALGRDNPGDTAVALVVKRLQDARDAGDTIYALIPKGTTPESSSFVLGDEPDALNLAPLFGYSHTATGLLHVAAAALSCFYSVALGERRRSGDAQLRFGRAISGATVSILSLSGSWGTVHLQSEKVAHLAPAILGRVPKLFVYAAADRHQLLDLVRSHRPHRVGMCRLVVVARDERDGAEKCSIAITHLRQGHAVKGITRLAEGVYYAEGDAHGDLAFVYTGAAAAYVGMGNALLRAYPDLASEPLQDAADTVSSTVWMSGGSTEPTALERIIATSCLSQFHTRLSRTVLRLAPKAVIGLSAGETNSLLSMGAWHNADAVFRDFKASDLFNGILSPPYAVLESAWSDKTPKWSSWRILASVEQVRAFVANEMHVYVTLIHSPTDCVIAGHCDACNRVIQRIGGHRAIPMAFDLVIHCPEAALARDAWRTLHHRPTVAVPGVRFYTSSTYGTYEPDDEACADALTDMAIRPVDFPRLIETAWTDGVRVFVEHGPRNLCSTWVHQILGDRPHVALSLDDAANPSIEHYIDVIAQLVAFGYEVDDEAIMDRLHSISLSSMTEPIEENVYQFNAHPRPFILPRSPEKSIQLPRPPHIAPVLSLEQKEVPVAATSSRHVILSASAHSGSALAGLTRDHQHQLAVTHKCFVSTQSDIHQQFLRQVVPAENVLLNAIVVQVATKEAKSIVETPKPASNDGEQIDAQAFKSRVSVPNRAASNGAITTARSLPTGPWFSRAQLEVLASGRISSVFGPLFEQQDRFTRQVRMPEPPLLLADRVLGIEGVAGRMGTGTIWTETDVLDDAWYLHDGYMPFGILVECGQADLLLISWLGADFLNRDERVYRLLGCEMTFHGRLPSPGDTLHYEIHIDGHAKHGDVRLFFFRYDCYNNGEKCLTMRNGQAGFFTDNELRESKGVIWRPEDVDIRQDARIDSPVVQSQYNAFSAEQVRRFASGDVLGCFGPGFEQAQAHVRTPRIPEGMMQLIQEVKVFDPVGAPWGRGYLRAETSLIGDEWYFPCHFKGDPAMPGTLMMEGCLQSISFYMTAMGFTLDKDGYRFEIVPEKAYKAVCRGQATPWSRKLVYEVFVEEVISGSTPMLIADVLVTVDGLRAFHCRRMGVRLVPDWPLTSRKQLLTHYQEKHSVAKAGDFAFGYASLLACAWGKPSDAFGPLYKVFDSTRRLPRLPGPPYHFMSRVNAIHGEMGAVRPATAIEVEYDIPPDAWYFEANGTPMMPYCVLLEAALQPCGWLTAFVGIPLQSEIDLAFRNLDGVATQFAPLNRDSGVLVTKVKLVSVSRMTHTFIEKFEVECYQGGRLVYRLDTVFGHFPRADLLQQAGLTFSEHEGAWWDEPNSYFIDLRNRPARFFEGKLRLPEKTLLMQDRITGQWDGSEGGRVRFRAEKTVNPDDWFFKAHFFQDPVQPGSLGLEAMIQLLQAAMIELGLGEHLLNPRFEPIRLGEALNWKYRGQVLPHHNLIVTLVELVEFGSDQDGVYAVANASLIVDGMKIYSAEGLGMRIVDDSTEWEDVQR